MEAEKFHGQLSASWRTKKAGSIIHLESKSPKLGEWKEWGPDDVNPSLSLEAQEAREHHIGEGDLTSVYHFKW